MISNSNYARDAHHVQFAQTRHVLNFSQIAFTSGIEVLPATEHPHLADILLYALSKLTTDLIDTRAPPQETEKVKRGVLCMRLVDVLLSSQFVKDLEGMKQEEEGKQEEEKEKEEVVTVGKDMMAMLGNSSYHDNYHNNKSWMAFKRLHL